MTTITTEKTVDAVESVEEPATTPEAPDTPDEAVEDEQDTFDRAYVEKLRKEAGDARVRAKDRDELAARLHTALVAATGRLADPTDLEYDEAHLADEDALTAAIDALLARKPHLANRRPRGDVGQGAAGGTDGVNLAGLLRSRA